MPIPTTVPETHHGLYTLADEVRALLKAIAADVLRLKTQAVNTTDPKVDSEVIANAMIAYRSLEDASMRLGKVLQALDGGVSVYDKRTTVGA